MDMKQHWDSVYRSKPDTELSWTQTDPRPSLSLIHEFCPTGHVIDVGGGSSVLAEGLLDSGYHVTVLDISAAAIDRARNRLGTRANRLQWIVSDVTKLHEVGKFDVWHDRAVFHFLSEPADRAAYVALLSRAIDRASHAVIATFAPDGPEKCSGLSVRRYDSTSLAAELGAGFWFVKSISETHHTPWGQPQSFQYSAFVRR
jgi:2-polyprenyl-3-methyl-5-hydroxy-6-metoxy-1,4-benzoquinol methylase